MIRKISLLFALSLLVLATASCQKLQARDNLNKGIKAFREYCAKAPASASTSN